MTELWEVAPEMLEVLEEFVSDIDAAYMHGAKNVRKTELYKEWPDLCITYEHACEVLAKLKPKKPKKARKASV